MTAVLTKSNPIKFLHVEDDDAHAKIISRCLEGQVGGHKVERARNGIEALDFLNQNGKFANKSLPDIILLDLKIPKKSGFDVLREIKSDPKLRVIPVVVLTTSGAEIDKANAYKLYANSYIIKPIGADRFRKMLEEVNSYWGTWNQSADPSGFSGSG